MAFNAYDKFKKIIINTLEQISIIQERKIDNIKELKNILEIQSNTIVGFTLKDIEKIATYGIKNIDTKVIEYEYGITLVDSQVSFYDDKLDICYLNQFFVIKNSSKEPIINITIFSYIPYTLFRNILKSVVVLDTGGCYTTSYETYTEKTKNEILKEEYKRNYHYEGLGLNDNSLIDSLNATSKILSFIYYNGYVEKVLINSIEQIKPKNFVNFIYNEIEEKVQEIYRKLIFEINSNYNKRIKVPSNDN